MKIKEKLWKTFSEYIRLRDADERGYAKCISCPNTLHYKLADAGHFIPKSHGTWFYFNEDNVHLQCRNCNRYGSNDTGYRYGQNLKAKIGEKLVNELLEADRKRPKLKLSKDKMKEMTKYYQEEIKKVREIKFFID